MSYMQVKFEFVQGAFALSSATKLHI